MLSWPEHRLRSERSLHVAIKEDFFDRFWEMVDETQGSKEDKTQGSKEPVEADHLELRKYLAAILKSELQLTIFFPTRIGDVPDNWIKPTNTSVTMSGKIRRVIKPGLRDKADALVSKAIVELD